MIRVTARLDGDGPGVLPRQVVVVDERAHQLDDRQRRVRVVHLDGRLRGKLLERVVPFAIALHDVAHGAGDEEVLLQQAQLAPAVDRVARVEDLGDGLGVDLVLDGRDVVAGVEDADVEFVGRLRREEAQHVHRLAAVADDGHVVRHADDRLGVDPFRRVDTVHGGVGDGAEDRDGQRLVAALQEPGRAAVEPVVGLLVLEAVDEGLAEEAELVVDAVAETGIVERGQGVEEAGRQTPETAVAEGRVGLEGLELLEVDAQLRHDRLGVRIEAQVREVVPEGAAHQELHGEVVEPLGILLAIAALALPHGVEGRPAHGHGQRVQLLAHRGLAPDFATGEAEEGLDTFTKVNIAA